LVQEIHLASPEEVSLLVSQLRSHGLYHQITGHTHPALAVLVAQPQSRGLHLQTTGHTLLVLTLSGALELTVVPVVPVAQPLSRGLYHQTAGRIRPVLEVFQVKV
jgi:hypothetical protein